MEYRAVKAWNWNLLKRGGHFHGEDLKQKLLRTEGRVDPRQNGKARKQEFPVVFFLEAQQSPI